MKESKRNDVSINAKAFIFEVLQVGITCVSSYYLVKWLTNKSIQQGNRTNEEARERLTKMLMQRELENSDDEEEAKANVRRKVVTALDLNEYETAVAEDVIDPADIKTTFRDVGGIDQIKTEIWDLVVLPILRPDLFRSESGLVTHPKGILLCKFFIYSLS